ncbi:MAG: High-affinity branched-chain amino acid transport system permease protein LivH [Dehalococcoidia bacterium]|nr:High-affinity branched-chain amino acid transport system permease protein LivH [Bacillota bacterium]MBT9143055.1 High-affinity branched-chain amino acid transport system permease protein LivH [Bacillota bacterium]
MNKRFSAILQFMLFLAMGYAVQMAMDAGMINRYYSHVMTVMAIFVVGAVSLNLINGICGQFSLGHAGFMAVGAYTSAIITKNPDLILPAMFTGNVRFVLATLLGGMMAAFVGFLVGLPSLRLRGDYLAIVTLGFGEIIRILLLNWDFVGGASGYFGLVRHTNFFAAFLLSLITITIIRNFIDSSHGRACISIREDEIAAETMGVPTTRYKVIAFVIASFFAGTAGSMMAHLTQMVTPASFTFILSIELLLMVVLGGLGSITGSIGAAIFLTYAAEALRAFRAYRMILYSLLLIFIMLFRPKGLLGTQELSYGLLKESFKLRARWQRKKKDGITASAE